MQYQKARYKQRTTMGGELQKIRNVNGYFLYEDPLLMNSLFKMLNDYHVFHRHHKHYLNSKFPHCLVKFRYTHLLVQHQE